ncbi:MAG: SAM-dependent methyltransferase [Zymomonas sp.]|nr:MAG: SAM-dependent methyltransferase [Zymomonas sp.]
MPGQEKEKGQFYTRPRLASRYYRRFRWFFDPARFQMVEPSAGGGAFLVLLPPDSFGCDIEPMRAGIYTTDFLDLTIHSNRPIACIGNPPFGTCARLAVAFFNHAATFSDVIAFIVPKTFRKAKTINSLDDRFHLLYEEEVPPNAFIFRGQSHSVPTVFQIWMRQERRRQQIPDINTHPDFEFGSQGQESFAMRRIGKYAGRTYNENGQSDQSHYFIKGDVRSAMENLEPEFAKVARNTAGQPSLTKAEIVSIYTAWLAKAPT